MTGQKIVENFDNLDQFVHEEEKFLKPIFLQVTFFPSSQCNMHFKVHKIVSCTVVNQNQCWFQLNSQESKLFQVDNFFITHWSLESKAKFLPYEFRQLHDLYTFQ